MSAERARRPAEEPLDRVVDSFTREQLAELVLDAVMRHDDVARGLRLAVARRDGDLGVLRREVDRALRTRRFLDYWGSIEWAQAGRPVVAELETTQLTASSR